MRDFARVFETLDRTTSTNAKVDALAAHFARSEAADAAWSLFLLTGRRPKRLVPTGALRRWASAEAGLDDWLFEECYTTVGDLAETIHLVLPPGDGSGDALPLHEWMEEIGGLRGADEERQREAVVHAWRTLDGTARFLFTKALTGALRVGVSQTLAVRGLEKATGVDRATLGHRLMGSWQPSAEWFEALVAATTTEDDLSRPYPFFLASPLDGDPQALGDRRDWQVEWKWDGIRAQLLRRGGSTWIWSRGEELVTDRYPEIEEASHWLDDGTVLDGELLAWRDDAPLPFSQMQRRIGRKKVGEKLRREVPVVFMAYDLLEHEGVDLRDRPLHARRDLLATVLDGAPGVLMLSPVVDAPDWEALAALREQSRARRVEGFVVKRRDSVYASGRRRGAWWKWKIEPLTLDVVLLYAQAGHGRRATLHTDYTFAVWRDGDLVPVAKAYSGLDNAEIEELDRWIRRNTTERFGPVRAVETEHVFEIAFEGIARSTRHKSGVALRFPRVLRWRRDKPVEEADTLDGVERMLEAYGG